MTISKFAFRSVFTTKALRYFVPSRSCSKSRRTFITSPPHGTPALLGRLDQLQTAMTAANWADYLTLVQNLSFWEAELNILENSAKQHVEKEEIQKKLTDVQSTMDCLIRSSDIRDDLNEVMEHSSRHAGIAGVGVNASDNVDNLKEHAEAAAQLYDELLKEYPTLSPKVESSVGQGLALLRQKLRFQFSSQHKYHF